MPFEIDHDPKDTNKFGEKRPPALPPSGPGRPPKEDPFPWKLILFYVQTLIIMLGLSMSVWRDPQTQWDHWTLQLIVVMCVYNFNYKNWHP